ncbi:hypothetical protein HLK59_10115 [Streptomyces sp. S3(2020)]|uniref:hypothetical protein n=1 Tax=Streptomyces sp. S3(2020) TaxID=2732044 RepID=UPI001488A87D|nr:hypothetical protein [Streptomyces sp. S3(2020)]NNN30711.1 hypothetical protein [Streptomyces sp. S3(2020)]
MQKSAIRRDRRATRRELRATLRGRSAKTRLAASCHRRPRSLATIALAAGVEKSTVTGCTNGLRTAAKRCGITPTQTARTRRTVAGGRTHRTHTVGRYTLGQVARLTAAYSPRKPEYRAAVALIAAFAGGAR